MAEKSKENAVTYLHRNDFPRRVMVFILMDHLDMYYGLTPNLLYHG